MKKLIFTMATLGIIISLATAGWGLVVVDEDFDAYDIDSSLTGQGGWLIETPGVYGTCVIADVCQTPDGCATPQRAVRWQAPGGSISGTRPWDNVMKREFPVIWNGGISTFYISIMIEATADSSESGNFSYVKLTDTSGTEATRIYISKGTGATGNLAILGRQGSVEGAVWQPALSQNVPSGEWRHIKLVVDVDNKKYDAYVGDGDKSGVNEGHWTSKADDAYFYAYANGLAQLRWNMYRMGDVFVQPTYAYLDNIYMEGPDDNLQPTQMTEIWVAKGVYNEQPQLREFTHVIGGFAGTERRKEDRNGWANPTVIDAGNTVEGSAVVTGANVSTIEGFTITGGYYGVDCSRTSPNVTNNVIIGNINAGVYCSASFPTLNNNTISGNGTGVSCIGKSPHINNNIITYNNIGIAAEGSNPTLLHNNVYSNQNGGYIGLDMGSSDISYPPLFVNQAQGDYHLKSSSPCIDRGDSKAAPKYDIEGNPRSMDGNGDGSAIADIGAFEVQPPPGLRKLLELRTGTNGDLARNIDAIVTRVWPNFFYIETPDRTCGIRVRKAGHQMEPGMGADVIGAIQTNIDGERYVEAMSAYQYGIGSIEPLLMPNKALGGSDFFFYSESGEGQEGIIAYQFVKKPDGKWVCELSELQGINNIGLFVTTFGKVVAIGDGCFYIDDGSRCHSNDETLPGVCLKVALPEGAEPPAEQSFVQVTGISSCYKSGNSLYRLLLVSSADDITTLMDAPQPN
ncbi:MAG: choice-of-anchor Q domain-containing protein [Armatimonadota bacterium]|nr:choice-of-anchor Q domain-containing protein [Armatimonadota bacterium]